MEPQKNEYIEYTYILFSNQAVNISISVLYSLIIFCAFLLVNSFSSRFIWKDFSLFVQKPSYGK